MPKRAPLATAPAQPDVRRSARGQKAPERYRPTNADVPAELIKMIHDVAAAAAAKSDVPFDSDAVRPFSHLLLASAHSNLLPSFQATLSHHRTSPRPTTSHLRPPESNSSRLIPSAPFLPVALPRRWLPWRRRSSPCSRRSAPRHLSVRPHKAVTRSTRPSMRHPSQTAQSPAIALHAHLPLPSPATASVRCPSSS